MAKIKTIPVKGTEVALFTQKQEDYISLTDIAKHKDSERSDYILQNWLRNRSTIEFLGLWEQLHNENFNSIEFDGFKNEAGSNSFTLTAKRWNNATIANASEEPARAAVIFKNWIKPALSLNFLELGNYSTRILKGSNSTTFCIKKVGNDILGT